VFSFLNNLAVGRTLLLRSREIDGLKLAIFGETGDREVRGRGAIDDRHNDARRQEGKRDEQADVILAKKRFGRVRSSRVESVGARIIRKKLLRARNQVSPQVFESGANHCAQTEGEPR
jgi:hypothetical protein